MENTHVQPDKLMNHIFLRLAETSCKIKSLDKSQLENKGDKLFLNVILRRLGHVLAAIINKLNRVLT